MKAKFGPDIVRPTLAFNSRASVIMRAESPDQMVEDVANEPDYKIDVLE